MGDQDFARDPKRGKFEAVHSSVKTAVASDAGPIYALLDSLENAKLPNAARLSSLLVIQEKVQYMQDYSAVEAIFSSLRRISATDPRELELCLGVIERIAFSLLEQHHAIQKVEKASELQLARVDDALQLCIQELVETVSTPRISVRCMHRGLLALFRIGDQVGQDFQRPGLTAVIVLGLRDGNEACREVALQLLGQCGRVGSPEESRTLCRRYLFDPDHIVRAAALSALQYHAHIKCDMTQAVAMLGDDFPSVRMEALKLTGKLASQWPDASVPPNQGRGGDGWDGVVGDERDRIVRVRMCDDCFMQASTAVFDREMSVRICACTLLGSLPAVMPQYLLQTLTKRVLTHTELQDVQQSAAEGEGDLSISNSSRLLSADAAGAFVVGLEDEFYEVRCAAVSSICGLMEGSRLFRQRALDVVIDMLSDEIDAVRLTALQACTKLAALLMSAIHAVGVQGLFRVRHLVELNEVHLQVVLGLLDDVAETLRHNTEAILSAITLTTSSALNLVVRALLDTLARYPGDTAQIYVALSSLGARLSALVEEVTGTLLTVDTPYMTSEADVDDPTYVGILVLVLSAATVNTHVLSLCPSHALRHWRYLRTKVLEFRVRGVGGACREDWCVDVQRVECMDRARALLSDMAALDRWDKTADALARLKESSECLELAMHWNGGVRHAEVALLLDHVRSVTLCAELRSLTRKALAGEEPSVEEAVDVALALVDLALAVKSIYGPAHPGSHDPGEVIRLVSAATVVCFALAACLCIASAAPASSAGEAKGAAAEAIAAATATVRAGPDSGWRLRAALGECLTQARAAAAEGGVELDSGLAALAQLATVGADWSTARAALAVFVESFTPVAPEPAAAGAVGHLIRRGAEIVRPAESGEHGVAIEFDHRLPHRMGLEVMLLHMPVPPPRLAVRITSPDGSSRLVRFTVGDVTVLDPSDDPPPPSRRPAAPEMPPPTRPPAGAYANSADGAGALRAGRTERGSDGPVPAGQIAARAIASGWIELEFGEAWSRPGLIELGLVSPLAADALGPAHLAALRALEALRPPATAPARRHAALSLGASRRYLVQPVVKPA